MYRENGKSASQGNVLPSATSVHNGVPTDFYHTYETPQDPVAVTTPIDAVHDQLPRRRSTGSMVAIVLCIIAGCALGTGLHSWSASKEVYQWVQLPGQLYMQAIQCLVVPMVFVNAIVAMADLTHAREAGRVGVRVMLFFAVITLICIAEGIGMGYLSRSLLHDHRVDAPKVKEAIFQIACSNSHYLEEQLDHTITCTGNSTSASTRFIVNDINNALVVNNDVSKATVMDNLITMIHTIIPSNIMSALVKNTLMSIVAFAIPTGITLAKSFQGPIHLNPLLEFLREVNDSLLTMTNMVLSFTPIAVLSLLGGGFGASITSVTAYSSVKLTLFLCGIFAAGIFAHMFIVLPILAAISSHSNPFRLIKQMVPTYIFSLGCASSTATLPVAMNCLELTRAASSRIMFFTMSLGTSIHKNGTAIYLGMMVFYLADMSSLSKLLTPSTIGILVLAAFLGAIGAAPVPGGSLAMLSTVWAIVLPKQEVPPMLVTLTVADVLLGRLVTMCNIHGSAVVTRIVEDQVDPVADEHDLTQFYPQH